MRAAEGDGRRALQAIYHPPSHRARHRQDGQEREEVRRQEDRGRVGHLGKGDSGQAGLTQPCPHAPPARHSGLSARPHREQGHRTSPARLPGVQRRLRRRPDGRARSPFARGMPREHGAHAVEPQRPKPGRRRPARRAEPGHDSGPLLHHEGEVQPEGRGHALRQRPGGATGLRPGSGGTPRQDPAPRPRRVR